MLLALVGFLRWVFVVPPLAIAWSVTVSIVILRTAVLPRWLGGLGVVVNVIYLIAQGEVLAIAVPSFPVWDLAGPIGSYRAELRTKRLCFRNEGVMFATQRRAGRLAGRRVRVFSASALMAAAVNDHGRVL